MPNTYKFFSPERVEYLAKAKFSSMKKFLQAISKGGPWWHRSKTLATIKMADIELMANSLGVHPNAFMIQQADRLTPSVDCPFDDPENGISERIELVILEYTQNSKDKFSQLTKISRAQISNITRKQHAPGFSTLQRIVLTFPTLSCRWLLTGKGKMTAPVTSETETLRQLLESKDELIKMLKAQNTPNAD